MSQPQKKNTPSTSPDARAPTPPMEKGLNQAQWKPVEPAGWLTATLTMPQTESPTTATNSMASRTHCRLLVQRMPATQMAVTTTSQAAPTAAAAPTDWAVEAETQPHDWNNWRV